MKGNKMLVTMIAVLMVMSAIFVVSNVTDFKLVEKASATTGEVNDDGTTQGGLTCGEEITFIRMMRSIVLVSLTGPVG